MAFVRLATKSTSIFGRIFGSLFFAVFAAFGFFFCALLAKEVYTIAQTYTWKQTDCLILDSKAVEDRKETESPYRFEVKYQYTWQGKSFTSEQFSRKPKKFSEYTKAQSLVAKFKSDAPNRCFVNPADPAEAILEREAFWIALFIFLPLIFVAIGVGGIIASWRSPKAEATPADSGPLTEKARPPKLLVGFFGIFFVAGAAVCFHLGIQPLYRMLLAQSWQAVPCTVQASRLQSHSSDDGTTYSIDILYAYELKGQEYKSSRYDFVPGSSSGYKSKAEIVRRHPVGAKTTCYVNPNNPVEAVLSRSFRQDVLWFGLLFPIPFLAVGIGGIYFTVRKKLTMQAAWTRAQSHAGPAPVITTKTKPLADKCSKSPTSRIGKFLFSLVFAAIWNGLISIPVTDVYQNWRHHHFEWGIGLFMIPFVLVGLGLIAWTIHSFLALFNPKVTLKLSPVAPALGDLLDVSWQIQGNASRLRRLRIYLEGREEVQYRDDSTSTNSRSGSNRSMRNSKSTFATFELANLAQAQMMNSGHAQIKIPEDTMSTWKASNNKIVWAIQVEGDIPNWPDIKDEFPVTVRPVSLDQIKFS